MAAKDQEDGGMVHQRKRKGWVRNNRGASYRFRLGQETCLWLGCLCLSRKPEPTFYCSFFWNLITLQPKNFHRIMTFSQKARYILADQLPSSEEIHTKVSLRSCNSQKAMSVRPVQQLPVVPPRHQQQLALAFVLYSHVCLEQLGNHQSQRHVLYFGVHL